MVKGSVRAVGLGVLIALATAAAALAAVTIRTGSYKGTLTSAFNSPVTVTFAVPKGARKVTALRISDTPIYCPGGGPPIPVSFKTAKISKRGTFSSTATYVIKAGPRKGQVGARFKLTGTFAKGGHEAGRLTTTWVANAKCSGSSKYTTKVK